MDIRRSPAAPALPNLRKGGALSVEHGRRELPEERTPRRNSGQHQSTKRKKRKRGFGIGFILFTILLIGVLTCGMIAGIFMQYVKTTLSPSLNVDTNDYTMDESSIIYYQDKDSGEWIELQTLHDKENRIMKKYADFPEELWQAAVAIEDQRFFQHNGVDWRRTIGATVNMFTHASNTYGGSTITQQLLKNLTGDNEGTVKRKVTEIFRALEFEKKYSKETILEMYLNAIYLGKGCYGVQTAAQYYFGKDVEELDLAECACLIAITNNPSMYGPFSTITVKTKNGDKTPRELNKQRQELILDKMADEKTGLCFITQEEADAAKAEELHFVERTTTADKALAESVNDGQTASGYQSWFVDQVRTDVTNDLAEALGISTSEAEWKILHGGCKIYTTIDPEIQAIAEDVYENDYVDVTSGTGQKLKSAITIVDVTNGNVVAMVGDMRPKQGDMLFNYATDPSQQCGSAIKPVSVYAPALDANVITPATIFDNYPVRMLNDNPWPRNTPSGYSGMVTLSTAIAKSINTVAVRTVEKLGVDNSFRFMTENLGFTTLVSTEEDAVYNDLNSSSLGMGGLTYGVTTEEMAAAYAAFANDGVYNSPRLYVKVTDNKGEVLLDNEAETHVAMKETTAYFMNKFLQGVVSSGTATSASFGGMAIAGKTGTTSTNYDQYFVGYTPYYSAAVWTGYRNNEKIVYSGKPAIAMWRKVMSRIHENLEYKSFSKPSSGITTIRVCADSGMLPGENCNLDLRGSRVISVEIATGTGPTEVCTMHELRDYCTEGQCLAGEFCPEESVEQHAFLNYTRENFGENVVADDNAYLISTLEAIEACPVHTEAIEPDPEDPEFPVDPENPGGGTPPGTGEGPVTPVTPPSGGDTGGGDHGGGTSSGGDTGTAEPTEPGGNWYDSLWGNHVPAEP